MRGRSTCVAVSCFALSCSSLVGFRDDYTKRQDSGSDANGLADGNVVVPMCVADDAASHGFPMSAPTSWGNFTDPIEWSSAAFPIAPWLTGGAFDGRYLYAADHRSPKLFRYDTQQAWPGIWDRRDVLSMDLGGFAGVAFASPHIYLVPFGRPTMPDGTGVTHGIVARYDTRCGFDDPIAWQTFDLQAAGQTISVPKLRGFKGATSDGTYVYFSPSALDLNNGVVTVYASTVARYDTRLAFDDIRSWKTYDLATRFAKASGLAPPISDGKRIYFGVERDGSGRIFRCDPALGFDTPAAWSEIDLTTLVANADGYSGGAFDGRYVYLTPFRHAPGNGYNAILPRYDTTQTFSSPSAWSFFDLSAVSANAAGFGTATFDGRFLHLAPFDSTAVAVRYDTTLAFDAPSAYASYPTKSLPETPGLFRSSVFDGEFVYSFGTDSELVRFRARSPAGTPALPLGGSFF